MDGLIAVKTLLDFNYKVQLLASSHLDGSQKYRPNHLFQSQTDVSKFLSTGARFASTTSSTPNQQFDALLFATQGLDLAIPSRLSYITIDRLVACQYLTTQGSGRCDSKLKKWPTGEIFISCPYYHERASIVFDENSPKGVKMLLDNETVFETDNELTYV